MSGRDVSPSGVPSRPLRSTLDGNLFRLGNCRSCLRDPAETQLFSNTTKAGLVENRLGQRRLGTSNGMVGGIGVVLCLQNNLS